MSLVTNFLTLLTFSPFVLSVLSVVYLYLRLNFYNSKSFVSIKDYNIQRYSSNIYTSSLIFISLYALVILFLSPNSAITCNINITTIVLIIYMFILNKVNIPNNHWSFGSFFLIIFSILLLNVTDLINFFFLLEVNTYLVIFLSLCQINFISDSQKKSIINSALITFITNFFSSFFIFILIFYIYYINGSTIYIINSLSSKLFFFFIVVKLSSGPWVYFGVEVYKGLKYLTLLLYTFSFLLLLLPKLFLILNNFYIEWGGLIFLFLTYILFICLTTKHVNSLKIFLAYSTSFNFLFLILFFSIVKL